MFSHVFIGVGDFDRALAFYKPLMAALDLPQRFCDPSRPWAGWQSVPGPRPLFLIGRPFDGMAHAAGNGQIRVLSAKGVWYAAPTLVHHYVTMHEYHPPAAFVDAVLSPVAVGTDYGWRS